MGNFTSAENADIHYMYGRANGNGRAALRMYHAQKLRDTRSFHATRHDAGRRRIVPIPSLEESILNVVAYRPESSITYISSISASTSFESGSLSSTVSG
ncbi:hypothetical protein TNCV_1833871 [Trichonephila clavipes]|nr:hypothetical protein TNCV_1833871 [Trichonephila clavipes]